MHDPTTRQMMDRPFKCHLCIFSSFSSSGTLLDTLVDFLTNLLANTNSLPAFRQLLVHCTLCI